MRPPMPSWWRKSSASRGKSDARSPLPTKRGKSSASSSKNKGIPDLPQHARSIPAGHVQGRGRNMKAMVLEAPNTPYRMRDLPLPSIEDHEVLVKIRACGICGTDLKVIGGEVDTRGYPRIAGHEPMGVVAAKGAAVQNLEIGDQI